MLLVVETVVVVVSEVVQSGDVVVTAADGSVDESLGVGEGSAVCAGACLTIVPAGVRVRLRRIPDAVVRSNGRVRSVRSSRGLETYRTVSDCQDVLSAASGVEGDGGLGDVLGRRVVSGYIGVGDVVGDLLSDGRSDWRSRLVIDVQSIDLLGS